MIEKKKIYWKKERKKERKKKKEKKKERKKKKKKKKKRKKEKSKKERKKEGKKEANWQYWKKIGKDMYLKKSKHRVKDTKLEGNQELEEI